MSKKNVTEFKRVDTMGHPPEEGKGPIFAVHNIYVKDLSFESPQVPEIFSEKWHPDVNFDLQMASNPLSVEEGLHEVVLHITVTVHLKNEEKKEEKTSEKAIFLIELKQAGVFTVKGFENDITNHLLATECPHLLFPYARETLSNLAQRGGFPPLLLPPINFEGLYAQHMKKQEEEKKTGH